MRIFLGIVLAIGIFSLGATHGAVTEPSPFPPRCPPRPGSSQFDPIDCRLSALYTTTNNARPQLGELWSSLNRASRIALDRVRAADGICFFGKARCGSSRCPPARLRLRILIMSLDRYAARLRSPAAGSIPQELRDSLATEALAIAAEAAELRPRVTCPPWK